MPNAEERIRRLLRAGEAVTRPALARAAGVSAVLAGRIVARLVARGEVEEAGRAASGGGRPVMQYRVAAGYGRLAHFRVERAGHVLRGGAVVTDMRGEPLHRSREMSFAMLHAESLDDWLDAKRLRQLPKRCVIVNVGRGNAVDERALGAALKTHRIAGAYLDVRKHEPSGTVPEFGANVRGLDALKNCIVTPHASAFSPRYVKLCFKELKDDGCL